MKDRHPTMNSITALVLVKVLHTFVWAVFAGGILAIPIATWLGKQTIAGWLVALVATEVFVLILNRMSCPLTALAAKYTDDRRDNFDIYLPEWLAKHNKLIFGSLYLAGVAFFLVRWVMA
jgi:hypothetical protein